MKCYDDGEEIKALTCEDRTYIMGRGYMPEGFDENLLGMERARPRSSPSRRRSAWKTARW